MAIVAMIAHGQDARATSKCATSGGAGAQVKSPLLLPPKKPKPHVDGLFFVLNFARVG
jgi:hypothetical protein